MYIIFGNFGDPHIAAIQWAYQQQLVATVVSIDTAWAASHWQLERVAPGQQLVKRYGFEYQRLVASAGFAAAALDRGAFPNRKAQWCPVFLKGMVLLQWLDKVDPSCEAAIILGKRAKVEIIEESEYYAERKVWQPLFDLDDVAFKALVAETGMPFLGHRSLECDPCIHNTWQDFCRIKEPEVRRTEQLEQQLERTMFAQPIRKLVERYQQQQAGVLADELSFDMGCGSPYACGE